MNIDRSISQEVLKAFEESDAWASFVAWAEEKGVPEEYIAQLERVYIIGELSKPMMAELKKNDEAYKEVGRKAARLIIRDREGRLTRYQRSQEEMQNWILWKGGLRKSAAFEKMKRMGLTGDVMKDMEVLER